MTDIAPLRFALLGAGNIARQFAAGVKPSPLVHVHAVASRAADKAAAFAAEAGLAVAHGSYEAALADPAVEAVYLALPNDMHAEWAIKAAQVGKHILCEKPLSVGETEAKAMFAAARANNVRLAEAYPYMAQPQTQRLRDLLAEGAIGAVQTVSAAFGFGLVTPEGVATGDPKNIRLQPVRGGGGLLDAGTYAVSLVRIASGERPSRVMAIGRYTASGVDQTVSALLSFPSGAQAQVSCSMSASYHRKALVVGSQGFVETDYSNHGDAEGLRLEVKRGIPRTVPTQTETVPADDGFRLEAESFARWVRTGAGWNGASEAESLDIAATLEAIAKSLASGRAEPVPE